MPLDSFFTIYMITRRMYRNVTRAFLRDGQDYLMEHFIILMLLSQKKTIKQNEITLDIIRNKATVTRAVDKLVERGLVRRTTDPQDRRINILEITDSGQAVFTRLERIYENIKKKIHAGISQDEIDRCVTMFERILNNLKK